MSDAIDTEVGGSATTLTVAVLVAVVVVFAVVGEVTGVGWFGYRQILYGNGELYAVNLGSESVRISVDGRAPVRVPSRGYKIVDLVGGASTVVVEPTEGERRRYTVSVDESNALLKVSRKGCLAASDIRRFYGGDGPESESLTILARLRRDDRVYVPETRDVVWPREQFPRRIRSRGPVVWIETVACELLDERAYLEEYLMVRARERLDREPRRGRPGGE